MKHLLPIVAVVCIAFTLTSCAKNYKCVCKDDNGNDVVAWEAPSSKKSTAESSCKAASLHYNNCVLK